MRIDLLHDLSYKNGMGRRREWVPEDLWDQFRDMVSSRTVELLVCLVTEGGPLSRYCGFRPYTENLAAASREKDVDVTQWFSVNTYPFGKKTNRVYPQFWGVCAGAQRLKTVLDKAAEYCEKPLGEDKTVVIVTDKWDQAVFQKHFERQFLRCALEQNVTFLFLLVTDYGVSRIPFLPWDRHELDQLRHRGYSLEQDITTEPKEPADVLG